jgi:hypothetical protein
VVEAELLQAGQELLEVLTAEDGEGDVGRPAGALAVDEGQQHAREVPVVEVGHRRPRREVR